MLKITNNITLPDNEIKTTSIRASGAGGQNVNKVSSAIHLRFNINNSSLPDNCKKRLLSLKDHRISAAGEIIIKAERHRTREQNLEDALQRLKNLILQATKKPKKRISTKPSRNSQKKRMDKKTNRGKLKALRKKIN